MGALSKLWYNLVSLYALVMLGRRTDDVRWVFMIGNAQDNLAELARASGRMPDPFRNPTLEQMWLERYLPERYDLDELIALSPETLGGAYARYMAARGLRPNFYDDVVPRHKLHYLRLRLRQTHDIWHVLTGFDTDPVGELGLQGFYFGQVANGQSAMILAGGILKSLFTGRYGDLENYIEVFYDGYRSGRAAHPLLDVRWEKFWSESLDSLRQRYGITTTTWRASA